MDIEEAIIRAQYQRIYSDPDVRAAVGADDRGDDDEWLFDTWAYQRSAQFPYIIQNVALDSDLEMWAMQNGLYTLHLWDDHVKSDRILAMRKALIKLHQRAFYSTEGNEAFQIRWWYRTSRNIPDEDPKIHHRVLEFDIRFYALGEVKSVLQREG